MACPDLTRGARRMRWRAQVFCPKASHLIRHGACGRRAATPSPPRGRLLRSFTLSCYNYSMIQFFPAQLPFLHQAKPSFISSFKKNAPVRPFNVWTSSAREKASQSFSPRKAKKKVQSVFSEDMRLGKNSSQPASVRASPARECAQRAAILLVDKGHWPLSTI